MAKALIGIKEQGLPPIEERLKTAMEFIAYYSGVCVFHLLLNLEPQKHHSEFNKCDFAFGDRSDYQDWRRNITFPTGHCYTCGCSLEAAEILGTDILGHGPRTKNAKCNEEKLLEFIRPLAYVVFHAPDIRTAVFDALGIHKDAFQTSREYAVWLGRLSSHYSWMSNLLEIHFAVATLFNTPRWPVTQEFIVCEVGF
jgi:hypothetical protein